jgi:hypothetical protein
MDGRVPKENGMIIKTPKGRIFTIESSICGQFTNWKANRPDGSEIVHGRFGNKYVELASCYILQSVDVTEDVNEKVHA